MLHLDLIWHQFRWIGPISSSSAVVIFQVLYHGHGKIVPIKNV